MAGYLVNTDHLLRSLFVHFMPGVTALPERDVDAIDRLPMLIFTVGSGAATGNGTVRQAQIRPVTFTLLAGPDGDDRSAREHAIDLGDELAEVVLERFPGARVAGVGGIARVTDAMSLPALGASTVIAGREVAQVNAAFEFIVQPPA